ncbi:hypothetical protein ACLX1H_006448 [Fusarium chlamydosporum]
MRSSGYLASLVAAGTMAVPHNGNLRNDDKHYEIITKFEYVTHYVIGGGGDAPQTTCVSQPQKSNFENQSDHSGQYITTAICTQPTNVEPVKRPTQIPNRDSVSGFGPSYGLYVDQQEAVDLHNDARKAVGNGPLSWDDSLAVVAASPATMSFKSINISVGSHETKEAMVSLIQRDINFFSYTNPEERLTAIKEIFAPDIVWFDFDGSTHHGHDGLLIRSSILLDQLKGYSHRANGGASVCQNMATARWEVVPEGSEADYEQIPVIQGGDVLVVEDGTIKILWSMLL